MDTKPKFPTNYETACRLMTVYPVPTIEVRDRIDAVRDVMRKAAEAIAGYMPEGAEAVIALRKMQEASHAAVFAIVSDPKLQALPVAG